MQLLVAIALIAQVFNATAAYTTADPVNPDRLGLATLCISGGMGLSLLVERV